MTTDGKKHEERQMAYVISEGAQELLKGVHGFCGNEVKDQARVYDITCEWPRGIYKKATEMQLHILGSGLHPVCRDRRGRGPAMHRRGCHLYQAACSVCPTHR